MFFFINFSLKSSTIGIYNDKLFISNKFADFKVDKITNNYFTGTLTRVPLANFDYPEMPTCFIISTR